MLVKKILGAFFVLLLVSINTKDAEMVKRVGNRTTQALTKYYSDHGMPDARGINGNLIW